MRSTDELRQVVAANVKRLRAERRMTLEQVVAALAERGVYLVPSTLHRLENGQRHVRLEEAPQVAAVFGVTVADLLAPPPADVPDKVEALLVELCDQADTVSRLEAELYESHIALTQAQVALSQERDAATAGAKRLRKLLRSNPEAAPVVATALAGRVPRSLAVEALPEDYWPEEPTAATDAAGEALLAAVRRTVEEQTAKPSTRKGKKQ